MITGLTLPLVGDTPTIQTPEPPSASAEKQRILTTEHIEKPPTEKTVMAAPDKTVPPESATNEPESREKPKSPLSQELAKTPEKPAQAKGQKIKEELEQPSGAVQGRVCICLRIQPYPIEPKRY